MQLHILFRNSLRVKLKVAMHTQLAEVKVTVFTGFAKYRLILFHCFTTKGMKKEPKLSVDAILPHDLRCRCPVVLNRTVGHF